MPQIKIGRMIMGICQTNCYFVYKEAEEESQGGQKEAILIDPADRGEYIYQALSDKGFRIAGILLTHGHFDHIWGANRLRELSGAQIYALDKEEALCESAALNVSEQAGRAETVKPDVLVRDGEDITIAGMSCRVIATPGHTGGSCCYYFEEEQLLVSGDTLFQESVGRTDFPTGSMGDIVRSIKDKLFCLPDGVKVYPGHGEPTTIGHEKENNPFCQ